MNPQPRAELDEQARQQIESLADWLKRWLIRLMAAYQKELTDDAIEVYAVALAKLASHDRGRLERAFMECIETCKFFPNVAEIRLIYGGIDQSPEVLAAAESRQNRRLQLYRTQAMLPAPQLGTDSGEVPTAQLLSKLNHHVGNSMEAGAVVIDTRVIRQLSLDEHNNRLEQLRAQAKQLASRESQ